MRKFILGLLILTIIFSNPLSAQQDYRIKLQSGAIQPSSNLEQFLLSPKAKDVYNGYYYRFIQFESLPNVAQKELIKKSGLLLLDYIPSNTFMVAIPKGYDRKQLRNFNIRSIIQQEAKQKISTHIAGGFSSYAVNEKNTVDIIVQYQKNISSDAAKATAMNHGKILSVNPTNHTITLRINNKNLNTLAAESWVFYINSIAAPATPEDTKGRSLHRSNVINSDYATGRHYDGSGVVAGLADDGEVGPHIDFQGRLTNHLVGTGGTHGDMTSGILAGGGNLDPTIRGMGTGAYLHVYDINGYPHIINAVNNFDTLGTIICSTSYSQGCNEYSTDTQFGDQLLHENPQLEFVFSAGNNGGGDCQYGAGAGWGNITGGYKTGKNVIACGNLSALEILDNSSSRGPASDGRVKPDICSNGLGQLSTDQDNTYQVGGGTSAASPGIAGILTQLYQAYKSLNGNQNPDAALIKASLLNSAEDIGNPGPDYTYGWGRVNALRALRTIEDGRYILDSISNAGVNTHTITVPAGVNQMRVMVYWNDPEGTALASKALVNDLDITLSDPSSAVFNPWILNPTPNAITLNDPAVRGVDTLNNMEQVTIDNPSAGVYTLNVNGTSIPLGPQQYYLVYEFRTSDITLTYPQGGEGFVPNETEVIRWDAVKGLGNFTLEFSANNGGSWNFIAAVNDQTLQYEWTVPNTLTGDALVRVSRGSFIDVSDTTFTIMNLPQNIIVDWACPDSIRLTWDPVVGSTGYTVYSLGTKYMDPIANPISNSIVLYNTNPTLDYWYSVSAKASNGSNGRRALAIQKVAGVFNCPLSLDVQVNSINPGPGTLLDCQINSALFVNVEIKNSGQTAINNIPVSLQLDGNFIVTDIIPVTIAPNLTTSWPFTVPINITTAGLHTIKTWATYSGDLNSFNDTITTNITVVNGTLSTIPLLEDFESFTLCNTTTDCGVTICGLNDGWKNSENGTEDNIDFRTNEGPTPSANTGPDVDHTLGTATGNYLYLEASGGCDQQLAILTSPCIDLTNVLNPNLSFWYHMYGTNMGELHLDVYADGNWTNDVMIPISGDQGNQWLEGNLSLSNYTSKIINIRFRGITGIGFEGDLSLDDINIQNTVGLTPTTNLDGTVTLFPNPSSAIFNLELKNVDTHNLSISVMDVSGRTIWQQKTSQITNEKQLIDLHNLQKGIYFLQLRNSSGTRQIKLTII